MLNVISAERNRLAFSGVLISALLFAASAQASDDRDCAARSCWMAAVEGNFASAISSDAMHSGAGGGLRFGLQRDLHAVQLIPELMLAHHVLSAETPSNATITMITIGGRMRFLRSIQPGLFAHVGGGRIAGDGFDADTDLAFDAGVTVDTTVFTLLDLGLHVALNRVFGGREGALTFATIGLHAALVLEDKL